MGTHIDAPAHFYKGSWRTQQIPIERLMGPGVIINIKDKAVRDPDYRIVMDDVIAYEDKYGRIPDGSIIMMNSGWFERFPDKNAVFNTQNVSDTTTFHFPGFHEDAVEWLIFNRHIYAVGGDTPSFDYGQSQTFPVHILIGRENVIGIENAAYLDRIPESGSTIFIPVVKIDDGSGGPTRLMATYDDGTDSPANSAELPQIALTIILFTICFGFVRI
ncbi:hypothetical protein FSP39_010304 [Pinctada imbricata]|uniref:Uncharacterized protein n=1 Tax=Pinctada imbricata TaxID=66713 RepID=A0AA88YUZ0_PINIB|nr:hypothetical protein FSP39_010304 [Pinctada imbricata]